MSCAFFFTNINVIFYFFFIILLISIFLILNFRKNIAEFFKRKKINLRIFKKDCLYSCLIISLIIYFLVFSSFLLLCFENISNEKIFQICLCFPIIHFLKSFPISISGWGIREIITIYLFSYFDIPNEIALGVSISLGAVILASSFYGLILSFPIYIKKKQFI